MILKKYFQYLKESGESEEKAEKGEKCRKEPDKKLILSDKFRSVLIAIQNMKSSNISKRLLELESPSCDKLFDISYIDIDKDGENITYLQSGRIDRLKKEGKPESEFWSSKMRMKQKIGRFITQLSTNKKIPKYSNESIEKFAKKFKAIIRESQEEINFELVEGNDIIYWYDCRNYFSDDGTLGNSCMSGPEAGRYLNLYRNNPDQCKLLILKENEDKIKGRALVWKLSNPKGKIFMDRVYTNNDDDEVVFCNYAKKQGWYYKDRQIYGDAYIVVPGEGSKNIDMEVVLNNTDFIYYPYCDTFRYFYPDIKTLKSSPSGKKDYYTLTDTQGHYEEWVDENEEDPMIYDAYNKQEIPERRAVWCRYDNAYCASEDAIRLEYNGEYAFPNSPNIVFSEYKKKWYAKEDSVFSKPLNSWVWNKYAVDVYHDKEKKIPPDKIHRFELNKSIGKIGDDYYDIDLLNPISIKKVPIKGKPGKTKTEVTYGFKE